MTRIGRLTQGMLVFWLGLVMTHLRWSPWSPAILLFAVLGGVALFSGLFVMQATLSFWTVESLEVANVLTYGGEAAAEYPLNVYAAWFRDILVFAVPIGCVTYLPMLAAIDRPDPLGSPAWIGPLAPAAGFLFLGLALFTWRFGIRRYASSGA
jgi:ABC-2 type transport system permease protein